MMLVFSNFVVSFSAGILCLGVGKYFSDDLEWQKALFVFFSTLCVYNFQRILKINAKVQFSEQMRWMNAHRTAAFTFTFIGGAGSLYFFMRYFFHPYYFLLFSLSGLVCVFYALQFLKRGDGLASLRDLPFMKIFLIALIWAVSCFAFPLLKHPTIPVHEQIWISFFGFLYVVAVTIPFDIRDLKYDQKDQRTIPQLIGWKRAKLLSIFLLLFSYLGWTVLAPALRYSIGLWASFFMHLFLLLGVHPNRPNYYFSGLIDGVITTLGIAFYFS